MRALVTGGCGFIGSHVVRRLAETSDVSAIGVIDNLCSGTIDRLGVLAKDPRVVVHEVDLKDSEAVQAIFSAGFDQVFHFAANPDIARAMTDPTVDFWEGTLLTQNVLEAMRTTRTGHMTYASGSGVYGDRSHVMPGEDFGPLEPVSTYGASKLGCEALISAYCHMFGFSACAFRFANVVGDAQTHGVTFDFVRKLRDRPGTLEILGDGSQEKSYVHVDDVVSAMLTALPRDSGAFEVFNVGTGDTITVTQIAQMVIEEMGLSDVALRYTGGSRGWRGDVPVVRFDDSKIRSLGWAPSYSSSEAIRDSIHHNILETD